MENEQTASSGESILTELNFLKNHSINPLIFQSIQVSVESHLCRDADIYLSQHYLILKKKIIVWTKKSFWKTNLFLIIFMLPSYAEQMIIGQSKYYSSFT